ncbi:hypothetical protein E2C01_047734 [Portunus trituberculatus]|uniref:Uncharacterized protein n=1 Tax=Portunus trituberculatus TaxID=210409 RepID=A0A5B7G4D6_PORTR|nr:hypothetical protein [Portunus trituberculatus]
MRKRMGSKPREEFYCYGAEVTWWWWWWWWWW